MVQYLENMKRRHYMAEEVIQTFALSLKIYSRSKCPFQQVWPHTLEIVLCTTSYSLWLWACVSWLCSLFLGWFACLATQFHFQIRVSLCVSHSAVNRDCMCRDSNRWNRTTVLQGVSPECSWSSHLAPLLEPEALLCLARPACLAPTSSGSWAWAKDWSNTWVCLGGSHGLRWVLGAAPYRAEGNEVRRAAGWL